MTQQPWGGQRPQQWPNQPAAWGQPAYRAPQPYSAQGQYPTQPYPSQYFPPQYQPGAQPPRRGNPLRTVLLALLLVVGVGFFLVSLVAFLNPSEEVAGPGATVTTAPAQPSEPGVTVEVPTEPDYDPPDIPMPQTYAEATSWVKKNAIYSQEVASTNCALGDIDPTSASAKELESHLNQLVTCLLMVWTPPMEQSGFEVPRPPVTVYTQPITTACGKEDDLYNASYCAGDQRIYYGKELYRIFPTAVARTPFMIDMVMGHEFGHLLQARSGILVSATALGKQGGDEEQLDASRRLEQQADCWSGVFLESVSSASGITAAQRLDLRAVAFNLGDDVLTGTSGYVGGHGSGEARQRWFVSGLGSTKAGTCNTFTVPASQVR